MTKGEHRDKVLVKAAQYAPLLRIPEQLIDQYIEYAVRRVWRTAAITQEAYIRRTVTLNHGAPLPDDWVAYGNRAYYTLNGSVIPLRYIPVDLVPTRTTSSYNRATPTQPDFYTSGQRVYFLPDTTMLDPSTLPGGANYNPSFPTGQNYASNLQAVTLHYYQRPPIFFGPNVPDSTDDGLPAFTAPYVHSVAFTMLMEALVTGPNRQKLAEQRRQESLQSIGQFFQELVKHQTQEVVLP